MAEKEENKEVKKNDLPGEINKEPVASPTKDDGLQNFFIPSVEKTYRAKDYVSAIAMAEKDKKGE